MLCFIVDMLLCFMIDFMLCWYALIYGVVLFVVLCVENFYYTVMTVLIISAVVVAIKNCKLRR